MPHEAFSYLRTLLQCVCPRNEVSLSKGINILEALNLYCLPEITGLITKVFSIRMKRPLDQDLGDLSSPSDLPLIPCMTVDN